MLLHVLNQNTSLRCKSQKYTNCRRVAWLLFTKHMGLEWGHAELDCPQDRKLPVPLKSLSALPQRSSSSKCP